MNAFTLSYKTHAVKTAWDCELERPCLPLRNTNISVHRASVTHAWDMIAK